MSLSSLSRVALSSIGPGGLSAHDGRRICPCVPLFSHSHTHTHTQTHLSLSLSCSFAQFRERQTKSGRVETLRADVAIKRKSRRRNEGAIAATEAELAKASKQLEEVDAFLMNQVRIFSFIISLYRMIEYSTN